MPGIPRNQQSPDPAAAKPAVPDNPRLWDRETTCAFFGGVDVSTLYRGMSAGRYPKPVFVSAHVARWLAEECEAALERLIAARDEPRKKPEHRGRPRGSGRKAAASEAASAIKAKTTTETETA